MRWVGVDPGGARVGIAVCDDDERIAVPVEVVPASVAVPAIRTVATREHAYAPLLSRAQQPPPPRPTPAPPLWRRQRRRLVAAAAAGRRLGERVRRVLGLPVEYEDERLSTAAAERSVGRSRPSDDIAAAHILQQFIDRRRREGRVGESLP